MPSKRKSSACVDYVPALCTHRPSLLPIEWLSEAFGLAPGDRQRSPRAGKFVKLGHLEEVKVVTRFPSPIEAFSSDCKKMRSLLASNATQMLRHMNQQPFRLTDQIVVTILMGKI
jgi:hypothetical protein